MPKVSVLTPVYNTNLEYLKECIDSILNQTFSDFEFIILNDSPDNKELENFILSYSDERIKYFKNEKNIGISASRNKLIGLASGEYLAIFDHDDISVPNRLEMEVNYLDNHPYVGVVSGWHQGIGIRNCMVKRPPDSYMIKACLTDDCYIEHSAALIRKSVLVDNSIYYEDKYTPAEDYRLFVRLMDYTEFYNFQEPLMLYRYYKEQTSAAQKVKMHFARNLIALETRNKYPAYWQWFLRHYGRTKWRIRLFGVIPFLKVKNNWVYLFELIPLFKIRFMDE